MTPRALLSDIAVEPIAGPSTTQLNSSDRRVLVERSVERNLLPSATLGTPEPSTTRLNFRANLPDAWSFIQPSGGVLMSVGLQAMSVVLAEPESRPLSATAVFSAPVPAGLLDVSVRVIRRGRAASQLGATVTTPGSEVGLEMLATFGRDRAGYPEIVEAAMPDVQRHEELPAITRSPKRRMPFFDNFEQRLAFGHFAWESEPWEPGPARYARWIRYSIPPLDGDHISELAYPPIVDLMPPSLVHKVGKDKARFMAPSLDLTVHFFERTSREWFLVSGLCRRAHGGTASAQVELFDDQGTLVAYATQVMILKDWG